MFWMGKVNPVLFMLYTPPVAGRAGLRHGSMRTVSVIVADTTFLFARRERQMLGSTSNSSTYSGSTVGGMSRKECVTMGVSSPHENSSTKHSGMNSRSTRNAEFVDRHAVVTDIADPRDVDDDDEEEEVRVGPPIGCAFTTSARMRQSVHTYSADSGKGGSVGDDGDGHVLSVHGEAVRKGLVQLGEGVEGLLTPSEESGGVGAGDTECCADEDR